MPLIKRGNVYWVDIRHNGRRVRKSTGTVDKVQAQEFHDQLKTDLWRVKKMGDKPRRTWKEAVVRWLNDNQAKKSLSSDIRRLKLLDQWVGNRYLDEIDRELVDTIKYERASQDKRNCRGDDTGRSVSHAEVNRMLAVLRSILKAACEDWEWLEGMPKIKLFKESSQRNRWLTYEDAVKLLGELPDHLAAMFRFSLATGLREENVVSLRWSQVDLGRRVAWKEAGEVKNGVALGIPLNEEALDVLRGQGVNGGAYVFTYKGHPVQRANNSAWRSALKRAGLQDFRWHDLRHTWASWHVQNGTPLNTLQELGGWKTVQMVRRYAHLAPENLAAAADNLPNRHILGTVGNKEEINNLG